MCAALYRSLIFVPGNSARFLQKAQKITADIVCFDLEDSVRDNDKAAARKLVRSTLGKSHQSRVFVRVNAPNTSAIRADLDAVVRRGLDGIVVPKVDSAMQMRTIARKLGSLERTRKLKKLEIIPSIESASGVVSCTDIAAASTRVHALVFGIFDLLHDMSIEGADTRAGEFARSIVPLYAKASNVVAIDSIWQNLGSTAGLGRDCRYGRSLGYAGKSVIHPDQLSTVHRAFAPHKSEIAWAKKVKSAYEDSARKKRGALRLDGKMIDEVHYKQACALLDGSK